MGYMETRHRISGMIDKTQYGQDEFHRHRVSQRIATFFTRCNTMHVAQESDELGDREIAADQNTHSLVWVLTVEPGNFSGCPLQCDHGLRFFLVRRRRCQYPAVSM